MGEVFPGGRHVGTGNGLDQLFIVGGGAAASHLDIDFSGIVADFYCVRGFNELERYILSEQAAEPESHVFRKPEARQHDGKKQVAGNTETAGIRIMDGIEIPGDFLGELAGLQGGNYDVSVLDGVETV
eukprot:gnl/MRDRNA2_/MRDRNA2_176565_c0_seq1.p2 gnl/MRDRNA2_/MRDRNA2_176565_c0~~gnl/MRDRNA2_/MRDRNA2_176565_c0_seq1.p2  ORF type:complete len:128 (+),score=6.69 gnl/MRDRNA2_/MRDRNA2_176565_c0_seq1:55-438(+)